VTLVVLGAFFYSPPETQAISLPPNEDERKKKPIADFFRRKLKAMRHPGNPAYPGENRAVFVAVISRMIIVPAILLPAIALLARYDPFEVTEDPVFILAAVLLVSSVSSTHQSQDTANVAAPGSDIGADYASSVGRCV
jgi:hypothetical protein